VGLSIAMAALLQGVQDDGVRQLVDTMPHVDITDHQRTARRQPAEDAFGAVAISGLRPRDDRRGIINPTAATAWLASWIPGRFAVSLKTQGVIRYSSREVGAAIIGIDPGHEPGVSPIVEDFVQGSFNALAAGGNNVLVGDTMAKRL
ncbi:ABC transporter permease, partial [Mesorhizobium sp. M8A.F.Ca.ET.161.01.1.1]